MVFQAQNHVWERPDDHQTQRPSCTFPASEVEVPFGDPNNRACVNNATRYRYVGPAPLMSAVAAYQDSSFSQNPVKLTMTQAFVCAAEKDPSIVACRPDGTSLYSVSSCSSDYNDLAAAVFSDGTPYVMVEEFTSDMCWNLDDLDAVTVYAMDEICHTDTNDATSFRAILASAGSAS
jgi:hypothetical protein